MRSVSKRLFLFALLAVSASGCANLFRDVVDKNSDAYIVDQAKQSLDAHDFETAINQIAPVLADNPTDPEVAYIASAARAGRAGMRILELFTALSQEMGEGKTLFKIFAEHYVAADDDDITDMEEAVTILNNYASAAADRTAEMNFYALFLYYSRIGLTLNRYAYDATPALRSNFRVCHTEEDLTGEKTGLPHAAVDRIMTTIPFVADTIPYVGAESGIADGALDLSALGEFPKTPYPCEDFASLPGDMVHEGGQKCLLARALVGGTTLGLGTGELATCDLAYTP